MATRVALRLGFALALLVFTIIESVASDDKCRSGCQGSGASQTFKYVDGTTYKYNLDSNIEIAVSSAEGQHSGTKLKATVLLTQLPQCNQLVRLQDVQVFGPDAKKYTTIPGIEKPIRINFHDGHIEDSICAEPDDNQNSLNIKRAVVSLFQAAIKHHYETDVFGVCPTEVSTRKEGATIVVHKSRNLNKCSHRETIKQDFMATAFDLNSEIKSSPILNGDYASEMRIKNGVLEATTVTESYMYVPFSVGKNGAKATVTTKILLASNAKETPPNNCAEPKSIIFENPHLINADDNNVNNILTVLKETKNSIDITVSDYSAKSFLNLVKILRASKKDDILAVYGQVKTGAGFKDKVGTKRVFLDAIFRAGTGDTIQVAIELLRNKELSALEQKFVYLGLAFVKHATPSSLDAAATLLDQPNLSREAYLGIGTLVGRYCREHSCENSDAVNKLTQKLLSKLGDGKPKTRNVENEHISVLKALANMGSLSDLAIGKIVAIAQDKKAPNRLRVAALDTYHADACKDKLRDSALVILKDIQQDSEIRIKAYLGVVKCPTGKVANALKNLLDNEPSYQVGGFILSHLRNLKATANPDKELARQQLSQVTTTKKFPIDLRKYSFNNEFSYAIDTLGIASAAESNVIYSQNSFLPRSTHLNLTAQVFGNTFNFLDIDARQQNLDRLVEHYLGPLGVLSKASPDELVIGGKASLQKIVDHFKQRLEKTRGKRDVTKAEIDTIGRQVQIKTHELNNDLDLDLSVKILGSELFFLTLDDQHQKYSADALIDNIFDCLDDGIGKAKNFEKVIQSNALFIDSEFSYPTSLGFPLRLSIEGSSSVQIKTAGQIDVHALLHNPPRGDSPLKISVIPSVNIDIVGSMTVDAQVVECGIKTVSSLYSATGGDLELVSKDSGNGLDVKFSLPVAEQKLISATHEIVFNIRELGKPEVNVPIKFGQNKDFSVCMDQLSPFLGIAFCVDINNPLASTKHGAVLPFPLSGNAKFSVGIQREDLSHYHYKRVIHNEEQKVGGEFVLETIGEKNDKKLSLQVEAYAKPEPCIKATFVSSIQSGLIEGKLINNNQEKSLFVRVEFDNQKYYGKAGVSVSGNAAKSVYKPLLEYNGPGLQGQKFPISVEGAVVAEQGQNSVKYTFDNVKLLVPNQNTVSVTGNLGREDAGFFSDVTLSDGTHTGSLKGKLLLQPSHIKFNAEMTNTYNPNVNVNVKYEFKHEPQPFRVDSYLQIIHGRDLASKINKLVLIHSVTGEKNGNVWSNKGSNKLSYPLVGVDAKFEYAISNKQFKYDCDVQYGEIKFGSELDAKVSQKMDGDHDIEFEIYALENKLEIKTKREVIGDKSKIDNCVEFNGNKFEVSGTVTHHCRPNDVNVGADLVVKVPGRTDAFTVQNSFILKQNELDTHMKISSGSNVYVDMFLKGARGGNANGHVKITFKNYLTANGQIKMANGAGNGYIVVDVPKFARKLKADAVFTIQAPTYNIDFTFYPDFEKDNNVKFAISTANQVRDNKVESRNFVDCCGKRLEANFKGLFEGHGFVGEQDIEAELILPTEQYFALTFKRQYHEVDEIGAGKLYVSLEKRDNKNTPGGKLVVTGVLKDANRSEGFFDLHYDIVAEKGHGIDFKTEIGLKRLRQGEKTAVEVNIKGEGSALEHPFETVIHTLYKDYVGSYKVESRCGPSSAMLGGKYDVNREGKEVKGDVTLELTTPSTVIHKIKFSASGMAAKPNEELKLKGGFVLFVDDNGTNRDATVEAKFVGEAVLSPHKGALQSTVNFQKEDPITIDCGYEKAENKFSTHAGIRYAKDKTVESHLTTVRPNEHEYTVDFALKSPQTPAIKLEVHTKKSIDGKVLNSEVSLTADDKKFVLNNELFLSGTTPGFDIQLLLPNGKVDRITAKLNKISEKALGGEMKLAFSENNFELESTMDANIESVDNFHLKVTLNSHALNMDDVVFEAQNKVAKGGKRIQVTTTSAGKNILSGSTNYKAHEDKGKLIVEGSGSFKVREDNKVANFKYTRQNLVSSKDGEDGVELSFNAGIGNKAVDAEVKVTNRQFRIMNSYCEEKQQCAHFEVDSKTNSADVGEFNHELEIAVDLRKLGLSHEFGLKGVTTRKNYVLDHTVDIYFQSKENKYQYSLYVHPNEAGAQLITPKRVIAVEAILHLPKKAKQPIKGELALYLNKKAQPDQKTALSGFIDCKGDQKNSECKSEIKLTNPALGKDLSVSSVSKYDTVKKTSEYKLIADVFPDAKQKIVLTAKTNVNSVHETGIDVSGVIEVKSEGLNVHIKLEEQFAVAYGTKYEAKYSYVADYNCVGYKYRSGITAHANPQEASLVIEALNKQLVNDHAKLRFDKDRFVCDNELNLLGVHPIVSHFEFNNFQTLKFMAWRKDNPNDKLVIDAIFSPGDIAKFTANIGKGGATHDLAHGSVKLDENNFLKTDFGVKNENVEKFIYESVKRHLDDFLNELKKAGEEAVSDAKAQAHKLSELLKKNTVNLKPLRDYYQQELQKLREELVSDKTIKEVGELLKGVFGAVVHAINEVLERVSDVTEKVVATLQLQCGKIVEVINTEIVPKLNNMAQNFAKIAYSIFQDLTDLVFAYIGKISLFIEAHQSEINSLSATLSGVTQELTRAIYQLIQRASVVIRKEWNELYEGFKALPIAEELKATYEQLISGVAVPETLLSTFKEAMLTLKDAMPLPDMKKFLTLVEEYVEKKLKREPVDDVTAIQNIIRLAIEIVNKHISLGEGNLQLTEKSIPLLSFDILSNLPRLAAVRFSPFNYLRRGDFPALVEMLYALSLNPKHFIPPYQLDAVVVQGQHIFTFDGKHLTFPGNCNYLLARDAVNGNFSIVGTFTDGILSAITVADKFVTVTLKNDGQILLNNGASEFPVRKPSMEAYRSYEAMHVWSQAGVRVVCGPELLVCGVHVSGFYHGQLRGLLGNGNSEPYDDYTMPNGKIVTSESEFGNAYKTGATCAAVKTVDHSVHHHNPACNKLFGHDSPFRHCYAFVNPDNFRTACDHGLAAGVAGTEEAIAMGYVSSCQAKNVPVSLPPEYAQCENGEMKYRVGETFSVKTPGKAADIVVAVDQIKANEPVYKELVQPVIAQIITDLATKGISDVDVHLISYGGEYQLYASHHTIGGKLTFKGKSPNLKFTEAPVEKPASSGCPKMDRLVEIIKGIYHEGELVSGQTIQQRTYTETLKYPFRAHAVKSIIAVVGQPCEKGNIVMLQKLRAMLFSNKQISLNLITPFEHFNVKDAKKTANVIGFNSHHVFTFTDAKKKPEGLAELYGELEYDDYCVDFTLKNRGNVFVTENFVQSKGPTRKQFVQTTAQHVVEQLINVDQELKCECKMMTPYTAENVCTVTFTKDKPIPGRKTGHKG